MLTPVSIPNRDFGELQFEHQCWYWEILPNPVSIPNRDFGELQLPRCNLAGQFLKFQSLIGILVNCNAFDNSAKAINRPFQSLIGILVNCNLQRRMQLELEEGKFVSIPNRDFGELQSLFQLIANFEHSVSIPNRDFGELQSSPA